MNVLDQCDITLQTARMIDCAKGCTPASDSGILKKVLSAFCYTGCLWRAMELQSGINGHQRTALRSALRYPVRTTLSK